MVQTSPNEALSFDLNLYIDSDGDINLCLLTIHRRI